ncbi:formin-like protein 4 [Macadamia integrifolia]|uniref:formin-like protein 4 n=1 Tax=Macadamia integrifolia TaxID=60698 RepID=UPI001C4F654B|nr:formin-like protein 4 [Macadamia integrifolia]
MEPLKSDVFEENPPPPPPPTIPGKKALPSPLKHFHWDKENPDGNHSMVWDMFDSGSFCLDGDLMEALFSNAATNLKPTGRNRDSSNSGAPAQVFILDPHKSQNTAIVLKSLAISPQEILKALLKGRGLDTETLEKLNKIAPTKEEETQILEFRGDSTKLADAESFLFNILKAVPSAFNRLDALLFRLNYNNEILQIKESLQTLESACNELKTRGLFVKLLEAILKAGNRMNAGTSRGNAHAFNLTALRKLSDVKSSDGTTTLLHFVVEEVVRYQGKRCLINRNQTLNRCNSGSSLDCGGSSLSAAAKEERRTKYIKLGLPVVRGLSVEFSNVKKAARIDYDDFSKACPSLRSRVAEIRQFLGESSTVDQDGFVRHMKGFSEAAEEEVETVEEDQTRVMLVVKRTTLFYQSGVSKSKAEGAHPLEIFEIVKEFLDMVDRACVDIARNLQRKKKVANAGSSSLAKRVLMRFQSLSPPFFSEKSSPGSSSSSEVDGGGS